MFNVLMVGVGGQGVVLTSDILTEAAMLAGHDAKKSEIHGMSQRGGPVFSHIRFGEQVHSPVIPQGEADVLFGLERMELLRWARWAKPDAAVCYVRKNMLPTGTKQYPADLDDQIEALFKTVISFDTKQLRGTAVSPKVANTVLLGAASRLIPLPLEVYSQAMAPLVPTGTVEMNEAAFEFGRQLAAEQLGPAAVDAAAVDAAAVDPASLDTASLDTAHLDLGAVEPAHVE